MTGSTKTHLRQVHRRRLRRILLVGLLSLW
jgi:hypothetical protein